MALVQELLSVGLTDKEAEVYLAALQLGYASVQEIAAKANINRTTAYTHIKNLISRGLINAIEKNTKVYYLAERPEKLKYLQEQQEKEIERRRELLDKIMPKLESIYNLAKDKPSVRYYSYENKSDLELVRNEIAELRCDEMYNIFNHELYGDYLNRDHVKRLVDSVQKFKALYISKNKVLDHRLHSFMDNEKFKLKFLPEAKFSFLCEVLIAENNVYIAGKGDWLVITDKLFAQTLGLLFHALWGIAEDMRFE